MLVLTRKADQAIVIGGLGEIEIRVLSVRGGRVKLGVSAHRSISIARQEISANRPAEKGGAGHRGDNRTLSTSNGS